VSSRGYAFGDSDLARERLALVADTFEPTTRAILGEVPPGDRRYVLDIGCGPGHATALLVERFPGAYVTGLDASPAMLAEARARVPQADFVVADVTAPLLLPAHVVFARLVLGHLADPRRALENWADALRVGGVMVCEEPVRYRGGDAWFERYERAVTGVVARRGASLWAGDALAGAPEPRDCARVVDRVVEHTVPTARAAGMFWRNAATWQHETPDGPALVEHFRRLERDCADGSLVWEIRQTIFVRNRA